MKFVSVPIKTINIYEVIEHSLEEFVDIYTKMGGQVTWCNGIIFVLSGFPTNDKTVEDYMNGIHHLKIVEFARMPKYEKTLKKDFEIAVMKVTKSNFFNELTEWLKQ